MFIIHKLCILANGDLNENISNDDLNENNLKIQFRDESDLDDF